MPLNCSQFDSADFSKFVIISVGDIETLEDHKLTRYRNKGTTLAISLPLFTLDQPWKSKNTSSLIAEIETSLIRIGHKFEVTEIDAHFQTHRLSRLIGKWHGWRHFSRRAAKRAGGMAIDGSVLGETLEVLGDSMPRYAAWLFQETRDHNAKSILEIGAGTGTMTNLYSEGSFVVALEPSADARAKLNSKFSTNPHVKVAKDLIEASKEAPFDQIVLINVLEHVEHDVGLLREARQLLSENGVMTVLSPAHNCLYSDFDATIGHVRRYTRKTLYETLAMAGFDEINSRYFNPLGAVLWLFVNRFFGRTKAENNEAFLYDNIIVPVGKVIGKAPLTFFGQSVIAFARNHSIVNSNP